MKMSAVYNAANCDNRTKLNGFVLEFTRRVSPRELAASSKPVRIHFHLIVQVEIPAI